jgi:hypothetical protein
LKLPHFAQAYRERRRQVVEHAVGQLQQLTAEAATTLRRNLACGHGPTEVRAAVAVLDMAIKAIEISDMTQRIEEMEQLLKRTGSYESTLSET